MLQKMIMYNTKYTKHKQIDIYIYFVPSKLCGEVVCVEMVDDRRSASESVPIEFVLEAPGITGAAAQQPHVRSRSHWRLQMAAPATPTRSFGQRTRSALEMLYSAVGSGRSYVASKEHTSSEHPVYATCSTDAKEL